MGVGERRTLDKEITVKGASQIVMASHLMIIHTSGFHRRREGIVLSQ